NNPTANAMSTHRGSISIAKLVVLVTTSCASIVSNTPTTTPSTLTTIASCSITHAIDVLDMPSDLRMPICLVRSVTVVYIASRITRILIDAATPTTTLRNTFNAGTPDAYNSGRSRVNNN